MKHAITMLRSAGKKITTKTLGIEFLVRNYNIIIFILLKQMISLGTQESKNRISETEPNINSRKLKNRITEMKNSVSEFVNRLNTKRVLLNWKVGQNKLSGM